MSQVITWQQTSADTDVLIRVQLEPSTNEATILVGDRVIELSGNDLVRLKDLIDTVLEEDEQLTALEEGFIKGFGEGRP